MKGVMTKNYHQERKIRLSRRYRLKRRGYEVIEATRKHHPLNIKAILDVGTADGLMLSRIKKEFPSAECVGLEYNEELIKTCEDKSIKIIQGDAQKIPFEDNFFDVVYATALIEHLDQPMKMLKETYRVLKPNGILIVTTPNPFFDKIAELIGHIEKEIHQETFNIKKLKKYFRNAGFEILETKRFMMSPIGFPLELKIEEIIRFLKLDFILLNQLVVGKKK
jgi:ubiquinone/menaquinone biosynthesis C-methylase UbiE